MAGQAGVAAATMPARGLNWGLNWGLSWSLDGGVVASRVRTVGAAPR
jgi:hypothetical protein